MSLRLIALSVLAAPALAAQVPVPAPGFQVEELTPVTQSDALVRTLADGSYVVFGASTVELREASGALVRVYEDFFDLGLDFAIPEILALDPSEVFAVYTDSNNNRWRRIDLASPGPSTGLASIHGWDESWDGPGSFYTLRDSNLASSSTVFRTDPATGDQEVVLEDVDGISALTVGASSEVLVAYDDERVSPGGSGWTLIRYTASQMATAGTLSPLSFADGQLLEAGLPEMLVLAWEPRIPGLYAAVNDSGANEVIHLAGNPFVPRVLLSLSPGAFGTFGTRAELELLPAGGPAIFAPFQPASGGGFVVHTDDAGTLRRWALTPARPTLGFSGPGTGGSGPFQMTVAGGPPNGAAIVYVDALASLLEPERVYSLRLPIFFGLPPASAERVPGIVSLDASGAATVGATNPAGSPGAWAVQALLLDDQGDLIGSSAPATL